MGIKKEQIEFRDFTSDNLKLLKLTFQNPEVMKYTFDNCYSDTELKDYLKSILKNNRTPESERKTFEYAVFVKNEYIGIADFTISGRSQNGGMAEIGWILRPEFWGRGYGTAIAEKMIDICFEDLNLHRVYAKCHSKNIGSERVMIKSGMIREGCLKRHRFKEGEWVDEYIYGLINPEFFPEKGRE